MEIFYRIAFTIIIAFVCTLLFIYYQIKDAVKYQNLSISSIRKIEIQLQNAKIFIEVISVSFGIERLVTLHVDNVHFEIKKAAAKADSVPVNITTITSIYNILLAAGNITAVRWFSEIGQLKCTDIVISGQEKDIALSIKQLVLVAARANSLDEAANIFKEGTTRLYSISVQLSRIAVVKNEDLQVLETIERALLSLVLSNHPKTSIMQVGLLISTSFININVDKLYGACNGNQNLRDFELEEESLAEKLQDFFILDFPRLSPLAKFVPSIAVIVPKLTISVPVRLGNIKTTAKLVFENCALILITNPLNPLQASIHAKLEHGAVDVLPLQRRFFTFSLISFWNEINIVNARNTLYPTFLPYRVDFDSFLTVTNPVLMVEEATILEFLGEAGKNNETSGNNSRFFQFSDSSFLESLFRIKVRMHLLNYTLGENLKSLKDKYCLSMTGNEFGFTLESLDKDNGQTSGSHGMLNLILDAAEISVSCVKQGNTPPKSSLISSPSVLVTMAMSSDFQMEVFLVLHSLVFNLESIYEEIAEFENFVFFVTGKFGPFLKSKTTTKHYSPLRDCVKLVLHAQLDDFLFIAGSVHPPHHATRIIGKKMAAKFVKNEKEFLSQYEIGGFLIQSAPHNYSIENIIDWKDIHFKQKGVGGLIVGSSKDLHLNVDLSKAFVLIKTGEMFMRLSNSFLKALVNPLTNGLGEISAERRAGANRSVGFAFKIPQVYLNVTLPESVKGIAVFSAVDVKFYNSRLDVTIKSFHSSVFKETEKQMVELAILNEIVIQISSATVTKPMIVIFNSALSRLIIPNDWPFANIVENGINLSRAVKHLFFECMQKDPPKYFASGDSFLLPAETPSFFVKSKYTEIVIVDNHFESSLGRNYKIGYDENLLRINREKEFMKKAKSKFPAMSRSDYNDLKRLLHMQKFPKGAVYFLL